MKAQKKRIAKLTIAEHWSLTGTLVNGAMNDANALKSKLVKVQNAADDLTRSMADGFGRAILSLVEVEDIVMKHVPVGVGGDRSPRKAADLEPFEVNVVVAKAIEALEHLREAGIAAPPKEGIPS